MSRQHWNVLCTCAVLDAAVHGRHGWPVDRDNPEVSLMHVTQSPLIRYHYLTACAVPSKQLAFNLTQVLWAISDEHY